MAWGAASERWRARTLAMAVAALAVAVHANALSAEFVWDDKLMVLQNPWLPDLGSLGSIFSSSEVGYRADIQANYYRPLKNAAYMLVYQVAGLEPWAYHLVNILLHAGASVLVFLLCRRVLPLASGDALRPWSIHAASFAAACVFAVHPVHTEPVVWIAALPEIGYSFFALAALELHARWRDAGRRRWYGASLASLAVALFWKEPAVATLPILVAFDWLIARKSLKERLLSFAPHLLVVVAYVAIRSVALGGFLPSRGLQELSAGLIALNAMTLFASYLLALAVPWPLNAFHVFRPVADVLEPRVLASAAATLTFACLTLVALLRRQRAVALAAVIIVAPLLPVLYAPGVGENVFAERYLYLPSVGFVLLLGLALVRVVAAAPRAGVRAAAGAVVLAVLVCSGATLARNRVWHDDLALWSDSARKSPEAFIPQAAMGDLLLEAQRYPETVTYFERALRAIPQSRSATEAQRASWAREVHNKVGVVHATMGSYAQAQRHLEAALALDERAPDTHNNLGRLASRTGRFDQAIHHFRLALSLSENPPPGVYYNLANAYAAAGMRDEAEAVLRSMPK